MIHNPDLAGQFTATVGEFARHRDAYFALAESLGATTASAEIILTDTLRQSLPGGELMTQYDYPQDATRFVLWGTYPADVREGHLRLARYRDATGDEPDGVTTLVVMVTGDETLDIKTQELDFAGMEVEPSFGHVKPSGDEKPVEEGDAGMQSMVDDLQIVLRGMRVANEGLGDPTSIVSRDLRDGTEYIVDPR